MAGHLQNSFQTSYHLDGGSTTDSFCTCFQGAHCEIHQLRIQNIYSTNARGLQPSTSIQHHPHIPPSTSILEHTNNSCPHYMLGYLENHLEFSILWPKIE